MQFRELKSEMIPGVEHAVDLNRLQQGSVARAALPMPGENALLQACIKYEEDGQHYVYSNIDSTKKRRLHRVSSGGYSDPVIFTEPGTGFQMVVSASGFGPRYNVAKLLSAPLALAELPDTATWLAQARPAIRKLDNSFVGQDSDPEEAQGLESGEEVGTIRSPPTEAGDMPTPLENPSIELKAGSLGLDVAMPE